VDTDVDEALAELRDVRLGPALDLQGAGKAHADAVDSLEERRVGQ
jgi:hypothetical protein